MKDRSQRIENGKQGGTAALAFLLNREAFMKSTVITAMMTFMLVGAAFAKDPLPEAPSEVAAANMIVIEPSAAAPAPLPQLAEAKPINKTFVGLAIVSTGSAFADSYTTLFARQNWLAGKQGVCNVEVESAYLYGTHPTVGRAYAVASVKSAASVFAAYYLRKHHSKFWSLPLVSNSVISLQGVTQNMRNCN
jgi:hypothetical protein